MFLVHFEKNRKTLLSPWVILKHLSCPSGPKTSVQYPLNRRVRVEAASERSLKGHYEGRSFPSLRKLFLYMNQSFCIFDICTFPGILDNENHLENKHQVHNSIHNNQLHICIYQLALKNTNSFH